MIVADHVTKYYGETAAVLDLSFRIDHGQVIGLLGLNGAGKTTTLRILSGLTPPTSGRVTLGGVELTCDPEELRARIGFLPETPPLYGEMCVRDYLTFVAHIKGMRVGVREAVDAALGATDLTAHAEAIIDTLSFGFRRRVGIAQAVVHRPALILLDEPTAGLDPVQILQMRRLIRALAREHTVIVSSHILGEIHEMCDRIFVMQRGRIAAEGTEAELAGRLVGPTTVEIEVRGSKDSLVRVVAALPCVVRQELVGVVGNVCRMRVELREDERDLLAAAIVGAGLGLLRLERVRLELERIFLALTGESTSTEAEAA
ncbi:MAG: ABC transporter ATP-binding protein [Myxococcota bacterium]